MVRLLAVLVFVTGVAAPARAAVTISFYSHDMEMFRGLTTYYPHAFALLSGTNAAGEKVEANLGFSATSFYPNVLWQSVNGALDGALPEGYVGRSRLHFSFVISDERYAEVMATVEKWRNWPQPSYHIDRHNCVHFIQEIAVAAGLVTGDVAMFTREPKEFLDDVAARNAAFLSGQAPAAPIAAPATTQDPRFLAPANGNEALKARVEELERQRRTP